jgi:hypothetical protein
MYDFINLIKLRKINLQLADILNYKTIAAVADKYTIDLAQGDNFEIETADANAKTIEFANVPSAAGALLSVSVGVKYTNAAAITYPASVVWQNGIIPSFLAGKYYELLFVSRDGGTTWRASYVGAW